MGRTVETRSGAIFPEERPLRRLELLRSLLLRPWPSPPCSSYLLSPQSSLPVWYFALSEMFSQGSGEFGGPAQLPPTGRARRRAAPVSPHRARPAAGTSPGKPHAVLPNPFSQQEKVMTFGILTDTLIQLWDGSSVVKVVPEGASSSARLQ